MGKSKGHKDIKIAKLEKRIRELEKSRKVEPDEKNASKFYHNSWDTNLDEVIGLVKEFSSEDSDWSWVRNWGCKYVSIRIDMRNGAFVLVNKDGERISVDQLKYQYKHEPEEPTIETPNGALTQEVIEEAAVHAVENFGLPDNLKGDK